MSRDTTLLEGFSYSQRLQLEEIRELVDLGELGGDEDGLLTAHERNWLAFWAWIRAREPADELIVLPPARERALFDRIMERIRNDGHTD